MLPGSGKIRKKTPPQLSQLVSRFRESSQIFVVQIFTKNRAFNLSGALFFVGLGCSLKWWYKDQLLIALLKQNLPALSEPQEKISLETGEYILGEQNYKVPLKLADVRCFAQCFVPSEHPKGHSTGYCDNIGKNVNFLNSESLDPEGVKTLLTFLKSPISTNFGNLSSPSFCVEQHLVEPFKAIPKQHAILANNIFCENGFHPGRVLPISAAMPLLGSLTQKIGSINKDNYGVDTPLLWSIAPNYFTRPNYKEIKNNTKLNQVDNVSQQQVNLFNNTSDAPLVPHFIKRIDFYANHAIVKFNSPWQKQIYQRFIGIFSEPAKIENFATHNLQRVGACKTIGGCVSHSSTNVPSTCSERIKLINPEGVQLALKGKNPWLFSKETPKVCTNYSFWKPITPVNWFKLSARGLCTSNEKISINSNEYAPFLNTEFLKEEYSFSPNKNNLQLFCSLDKKFLELHAGIKRHHFLQLSDQRSKLNIAKDFFSYFKDTFNENKKSDKSLSNRSLSKKAAELPEQLQGAHTPSYPLRGICFEREDCSLEENEKCEKRETEKSLFTGLRHNQKAQEYRRITNLSQIFEPFIEKGKKGLSVENSQCFAQREAKGHSKVDTSSVSFSTSQQTNLSEHRRQFGKLIPPRGKGDAPLGCFALPLRGNTKHQQVAPKIFTTSGFQNRRVTPNNKPIIIKKLSYPLELTTTLTGWQPSVNSAVLNSYLDEIPYKLESILTILPNKKTGQAQAPRYAEGVSVDQTAGVSVSFFESHKSLACSGYKQPIERKKNGISIKRSFSVKTPNETFLKRLQLVEINQLLRNELQLLVNKLSLHFVDQYLPKKHNIVELPEIQQSKRETVTWVAPLVHPEGAEKYFQPKALASNLLSPKSIVNGAEKGFHLPQSLDQVQGETKVFTEQPRLHPELEQSKIARDFAISQNRVNASFLSPIFTPEGYQVNTGILRRLDASLRNPEGGKYRPEGAEKGYLRSGLGGIKVTSAETSLGTTAGLWQLCRELPLTKLIDTNKANHSHPEVLPTNFELILKKDFNQRGFRQVNNRSLDPSFTKQPEGLNVDALSLTSYPQGGNTNHQQGETKITEVNKKSTTETDHRSKDKATHIQNSYKLPEESKNSEVIRSGLESEKVLLPAKSGNSVDPLDLLNHLGLTFNNLSALNTPPVLLPISNSASVWKWKKPILAKPFFDTSVLCRKIKPSAWSKKNSRAERNLWTSLSEPHSGSTSNIPKGSETQSKSQISQKGKKKAPALPQTIFHFTPKSLTWEILHKPNYNKHISLGSTKNLKKRLKYSQLFFCNKVVLKEKKIVFENITGINPVDKNIDFKNRKSRFMSGYVYPDIESNLLKANLCRGIPFLEKKTNCSFNGETNYQVELQNRFYWALYPKSFQQVYKSLDQTCLASVQIPIAGTSSLFSHYFNTSNLQVDEVERTGSKKVTNQPTVPFLPLPSNFLLQSIPLPRRSTGLGYDNEVQDATDTPFPPIKKLIGERVENTENLFHIRYAPGGMLKMCLDQGKEIFRYQELNHHLSYFPGFTRPNQFLFSLTQIAHGFDASTYSERVHDSFSPQGSPKSRLGFGGKELDSAVVPITSEKTALLSNNLIQKIVDYNSRKTAYRGIVMERNSLTKDFQPLKDSIKEYSLWGTSLLGSENPFADRQSHFFGERQLSTIDTNTFQRDYLRQLGKETLTQSNRKGWCEAPVVSSAERAKILSFSKTINSLSLKKRKYTYLLKKKDQWHLLFQEQLRTVLEDPKKYPPLAPEEVKNRVSHRESKEAAGRIKISAPLVMARFPKRLFPKVTDNRAFNTSQLFFWRWHKQNSLDSSQPQGLLRKHDQGLLWSDKDQEAKNDYSHKDNLNSQKVSYPLSERALGTAGFPTAEIIKTSQWPKFQHNYPWRPLQYLKPCERLSLTTRDDTISSLSEDPLLYSFECFDGAKHQASTGQGVEFAQKGKKKVVSKEITKNKERNFSIGDPLLLLSYASRCPEEGNQGAASFDLRRLRNIDQFFLLPSALPSARSVQSKGVHQRGIKRDNSKLKAITSETCLPKIVNHYPFFAEKQNFELNYVPRLNKSSLSITKPRIPEAAFFDFRRLFIAKQHVTHYPEGVQGYKLHKPVTSKRARISEATAGYDRAYLTDPVINLQWLTQEALTFNSWAIVYQWSFLVALLFWVEQILVSNVFPSLSALEQLLLGANSLRSNDRANVIRVSQNETPKFQDIAGVDGLLGELAELVLFLRGHKKRLWSKKNSYGVLLTGPPGTGKTFLVRALANQAGVPVLILSAGALTANRLSNNKPSWSIRHAFRRAKQLAPCILFIDEIDALGRSRGEIVTDINEITADTDLGLPDLHKSSSERKNSINTLNSGVLDKKDVSQNWSSIVYPEGVQNAQTKDLSIANSVLPKGVTINNEINRYSLSQENQLDFSKIFGRASNKKVQTNGVYPEGVKSVNRNTVDGLENFKDRQEKRKFGPLTQLLVSMDGVQSLPGVLVIGATNRPESLDKALTRPGRFERIIRIEKPAEEKRIEILKLYSHNLGVQHKIPWSYLANRTVGLTAADLAVAMNYSSLKAIAQGSLHTIETIEYGLDSISRVPNTTSLRKTRFSDLKNEKQSGIPSG